MARAGWNIRWWGLGLLLGLAQGCDDPNRPLDGGRPLKSHRSALDDKMNAKDPCWRLEKGRWHHSFGHCHPMTEKATIEGVWVTAFEEISFFPGAKQKPDPLDPRRYSTEIELDDKAVFRAMGRESEGPEAEAVYLRFTGRRTRDPLGVDCYGTPSFDFVVDHLIEAKYLGRLKPVPISHWQDLARNRPLATVRRVHEGRWGEIEEEAVKRCRPRGRADQTGSQPSPAGSVSAE
ncbi:MAG: hypothetical protein ABIW83_01590 [Allosphingosinicella sp.]